MPLCSGFGFDCRPFADSRFNLLVAGLLFFPLLLLPSVSYTLTLERPAVNVDWGKVQARPAKPNLKYAANRLFGTVQFRGPIKDLPQWERVLRLYKDRGSIDADFAKSNRQAELKTWLKLKADAAKMKPEEMLLAVNKFFNMWPYRTDMDVYGLVDYWATPAEFISKSGDCEDYSITKMFALIELGFNPEDLRVAVVRDTIRNIAHAVLAATIGDEVYILDNTTPLLLSHSKYGHYQPAFSVNLFYKWMHVPPAK
jgi:predicted transglutaminase-like cysteine proteinase